MTLSHMMRAVEISQPGGPEVLKPVELPVPVPGHGQIVIRVAYAGREPARCAATRRGLCAARPAPRPCRGWRLRARWSKWGRVSTAGQIGDEVCALLPGGGYAEYVVTNAAHALPVPAGHEPARGRLPAGNLLHRLVQHGAARAADGGRAVPGAWRLVRDRHDGDPDRRRAWARGSSPRPGRTRNARPA